MCGLFENGLDMKTFYEGGEPEYKLIEEYFDVLKRLKDEQYFKGYPYFSVEEDKPKFMKFLNNLLMLQKSFIDDKK